MGSVTDASVACADYDAATEYGSTMQSDNCDSEVAVSWENTDLIPGDGAGCCCGADLHMGGRLWQ